MLKDKQFDNI